MSVNIEEVEQELELYEKAYTLSSKHSGSEKRRSAYMSNHMRKNQSEIPEDSL